MAKEFKHKGKQQDDSFFEEGGSNRPPTRQEREEVGDRWTGRLLYVVCACGTKHEVGPHADAHACRATTAKVKSIRNAKLWKSFKAGK